MIFVISLLRVRFPILRITGAFDPVRKKHGSLVRKPEESFLPLGGRYRYSAGERSFEERPDTAMLGPAGECREIHRDSFTIYSHR
jgi:hypothetical protein